MVRSFLNIKILIVAFCGVFLGGSACYLYEAVLVPYLIENRMDLPVYTYSLSRVKSIKEIFLNAPGDSTFKELDLTINHGTKTMFYQENIPYYLIYSNRYNSSSARDWLSRFSNEKLPCVAPNKSMDNLFSYIISVSDD